MIIAIKLHVVKQALPVRSDTKWRQYTVYKVTTVQNAGQNTVDKLPSYIKTTNMTFELATQHHARWRVHLH